MSGGAGNTPNRTGQSVPSTCHCAFQALIEVEQNPVYLSHRHQTGDWGDLYDEDKKENELSVKEGFRILSAYKLETGVKVWVITEWDRSATTILLPNEY